MNSLRFFRGRHWTVAALVLISVRAGADTVIVESKRNGALDFSGITPDPPYAEVAGTWNYSTSKSTAPGCTPSIGSRFANTNAASLCGLVARSPGFSPVDRDLPQPDGIYFEPHWGRRFVGTAGPISAASRDVFQPDIGKSWARMTPNFRRPTGTLAECGCRFNFRIPFQVTPSRPAWEDAGLRR